MTDEPEDDLATRIKKLQDELSQIETPELHEEAVDQKRQNLVDSVPSSSKELPDIPEWTPPKRTQNEENERRMAADQKAYRGLGVGLTIAYTIIGLPLVGLAIGWALDTAATGGNLFRALGCVAGMTLGVFMAIRMMNANESRM